jgi:hypothetical protein
MQPMTQTMVAAAHITLPSKKTHTHPTLKGTKFKEML